MEPEEEVFPSLQSFSMAYEPAVARDGSGGLSFIKTCVSAENCSHRPAGMRVRHILLKEHAKAQRAGVVMETELPG